MSRANPHGRPAPAGCRRHCAGQDQPGSVRNRPGWHASPYGVTRNSFDPDFLGGGSSAVRQWPWRSGWPAFALGTDTAGSGRIPAAFNNLVGLKPSCGALSNRGVVPACRCLDSISLLPPTRRTPRASRASRAASISGSVLAPRGRPHQRRVVTRHERSRRRTARNTMGILRRRGLRKCLPRRCGAWARWEARRRVDLAPLIETARLLYEGPWVAERYLATRPLLTRTPAPCCRSPARSSNGARRSPGPPTPSVRSIGCASCGARPS